jgi:tRNA (guanine-N(7)-)-methyltransferase subunit TRM82
VLSIPLFFCSYSLEEEASNTGKLILGHVSMVTCAKLSHAPNQGFVLSGDRDEKIRVSQFPDGHNIETFCLGHTQFVSQIEFVDAGLLVSGGGDDFLALWNWKAGELLQKVDIREYLNVR